MAVACPGRLGDLIERGSIRLDAVEIVVIDEADRMADMGFLPDVRRLLDLTPSDRQTLLFSATLDGDIDVLVRRYQHEPARHELDADEDDSQAAVHLFWKVSSGDRVDRTADVAVRRDRPSCSAGPSTGPTGSPASSSNEECERRPSTATAARSNASGRWTPSSEVRSTRWWRRTWPPAASTSTGSTRWSTSTRPRMPRTTCTDRGGRPRAGATGVVVSLVTPDKAGAVKRIQRDLGLPLGTTTPAVGEITAVVGQPPERRPSDPRRPAQVAKRGGSGPRTSGRPSRPWKGRPPSLPQRLVDQWVTEQEWRWVRRRRHRGERSKGRPQGRSMLRRAPG